jgi:hypothetical protein
MSSHSHVSNSKEFSKRNVSSWIVQVLTLTELGSRWFNQLCREPVHVIDTFWLGRKENKDTFHLGRKAKKDLVHDFIVMFLLFSL